MAYDYDCNDFGSARPGIISEQSARMTARLARYSAIMQWARNRYTQGDSLTVAIGYQPSIYSRIEKAAWRKYAA